MTSKSKKYTLASGKEIPLPTTAADWLAIRQTGKVSPRELLGIAVAAQQEYNREFFLPVDSTTRNGYLSGDKLYPGRRPANKVNRSITIGNEGDPYTLNVKWGGFLNSSTSFLRLFCTAVPLIKVSVPVPDGQTGTAETIFPLHNQRGIVEAEFWKWVTYTLEHGTPTVSPGKGGLIYLPGQNGRDGQVVRSFTLGDEMQD